MRVLKTVEEFMNAVKEGFIGQAYYVSMNVMFSLINKGIISNDSQNRLPEDSRWKCKEGSGWIKNLQNEKELFEEHGSKEGFCGLLGKIFLCISDPLHITTKDGAHRSDFILKVFNKELDNQFRNKLIKDDFINKLCDGDDDAIEDFGKLLVPVAFVDESSISDDIYVATNSGKTMKPQQVLKYSMRNNELNKKMIETCTGPFSLVSSGSSQLETSAIDTLALLGYLGFDAEATKIKTAEYMLHKYNHKTSIDKFHDLSERFMMALANEDYSFVFNPNGFRNSYMYGFLNYVRTVSCSLQGETKTSISKKVKEDESFFFEFLEKCISLMEKKSFSKKFTTKKVKEALENKEGVRKDGTGSFSAGTPIFNILNMNVNFRTKWV